MTSLYALLVAIDAYPEGIRSLAGCVNDANAIDDLLRKRFGESSLYILRLNNAEATRERIIQSFREHLGHATKDDVALFYFAGHGSQVPTDGLFKEIEPDGMNESIVCYDSRVLGAFDLVDKDIATLIREVTAKGVRLTTIMDSCHSGSITRGLEFSQEGSTELDDSEAMLERRLPPRLDAQPACAYLCDPAVIEAAVRDIPAPPSGAGSLTLATAAGFIPDETGTHVLLAACEDNQSAKEYLAGRVRHGAFTYFLTQTLQTAPGPLGYRELMQLVRERMRDRVADQTPKLESSGGAAIFDNVFLGLTPGPIADYSIATQRITGIWTIDSGSLLGIAEGDQFALYPDTSEGADLVDPQKAVATAVAAGVRPSETVLEICGETELIDGAMYKTVIISRSATISVGFDCEEEALATIRSALSSARSIREGIDPRFVVHANGGNFIVTTGGGTRALYGPVEQSDQGALRVIAALEHMAMWTMRLALSNPSPKIPADSVQFIITTNGAELSSPPVTQIELAYTRDKFGQESAPTFKARFANTYTMDLNIALLVFSEDWSITAQLLEAGTQRLATPIGRDPVNPPLPVHAKSGLDIPCSIDGNGTEATDYLLLVVSTDWFDAHRYELPPLDDAMVNRRAIDVDQTPPLHDFFTRRVALHTTRKFK